MVNVSSAKPELSGGFRICDDFTITGYSKIQAAHHPLQCSYFLGSCFLHF